MGEVKKGRRIALLSGVALLVPVAVLIGVSWEEARTRYLFWRRFEGLGDSAQGYPEFRDRRTGIVFVRLPGGEYWMGTSDDDGKRLVAERVTAAGAGNAGEELITEHIAVEQPLHRVTLSPFLISKYEISQAQWKRVMASTDFIRGLGGVEALVGETLPVAAVSWEECKAFCARTGLSLPSEAQWEYACRAGTKTRSAFGDKLTGQQANFYGDGTAGTVEVDSFRPNGFGLYNMHGNVGEWCEDLYDPAFYRRPEASRKDPVCLSGSESRVVRGGSCFEASGACRSSFRLGLHPASHNPCVGLRPCRPLSR